MIDKERLEDIKEDVENNCKKEYEFVTTILYEDAKLLISTVEEQQKEIDDVKKWHKKDYEEMCRLQDENARLREALEFYADENNHYVEFPDIDMNAVEKDGGTKARQALRGCNKMNIPWSKEQLMKTNQKLMDEKNCYKQALNQIVNAGTYGTDIHSKEVVRSAEAKIAYQALEWK